MANKPHNASDPVDVNKKEQKSDDKRTQELEDIKYILGSKPGMRFFRRMFVEGKLFSTTFTGNSHTFFLEGHRNHALIYFNDVAEAAPHKIANLMIDKGDDDV